MMMGRAIKSLYPEATFSVEDDNYDTITWYSAPDPLPTLEQLQAEMSRLQAADAANHYQTQRRNEYPRLQEQLDMLWHGMDADFAKRIEPFYSTILAVKNKYPKA